MEPLPHVTTKEDNRHGRFIGGFEKSNMHIRLFYIKFAKDLRILELQNYAI